MEAAIHKTGCNVILWDKAAPTVRPSNSTCFSNDIYKCDNIIEWILTKENNVCLSLAWFDVLVIVHNHNQTLLFHGNCKVMHNVHSFKKPSETIRSHSQEQCESLHQLIYPIKLIALPLAMHPVILYISCLALLLCFIASLFKFHEHTHPKWHFILILIPKY